MAPLAVGGAQVGGASRGVGRGEWAREGVRHPPGVRVVQQLHGLQPQGADAIHRLERLAQVLGLWRECLQGGGWVGGWVGMGGGRVKGGGSACPPHTHSAPPQSRGRRRRRPPPRPARRSSAPAPRRGGCRRTRRGWHRQWPARRVLVCGGVWRGGGCALSGHAAASLDPPHLVQAQQRGVQLVAAVLQRGELPQRHQLGGGGGGEVALVQPPLGGVCQQVKPGGRCQGV